MLASLYAASAADVQLLGDRPGQRTAKRVRPVRLVEPAGPGLVAEHGGVNVHAETRVDGRDRRRLEQLGRYVARPPVATERLTLLPDGRVRLAFKAPWRDGTDAVILSPMDFIARLCALVPPPRFHLVRYAGTLAARAACRRDVVPGRPAPPPPAQPSLFDDADLPPLAPPRPASRHLWSWLLRRVFTVEVDTCPEPACGGAMRLVHLASSPVDNRRGWIGVAMGSSVVSASRGDPGGSSSVRRRGGRPQRGVEAPRAVVHRAARTERAAERRMVELGLAPRPPPGPPLPGQLSLPLAG